MHNLHMVTQDLNQLSSKKKKEKQKIENKDAIITLLRLLVELSGYLKFTIMKFSEKEQ